MCVLFAIHYCPKHFHIIQKYITNQNQRGICYAVKDIIRDCIQKMTEVEEREDEKNGADKHWV